MKASLRFLLALSLAGGALLSGCGGDNDNNAAEQNTGPRVDLRLMETTDIHTNVMDYNYYSDSVDNGHGLVRTAMLVKQARAEITYPENSALVDNGDLIQGSPMGDWRQAQGLTWISSPKAWTTPPFPTLAPTCSAPTAAPRILISTN